MKRAIIALALLLAGCRDEIPTAAPHKAGPRQDPNILTTFNLPNSVRDVMATACWHCHNRATESANPLSIKITQGSPWTISNVSAQMLHDAFRYDQAPADVVLTGAQRQTLAAWTMGLGASGTATVPYTFYWDQDTHQSGLTVPGDGYQDHGYEGQRLEDRQQVNLTIINHTTSDGVNHNWLRINHTTAVSSDSSLSDDATVYIFPAGVPGMNRLQEFVIHADVMFEKRFFIVAQVEQMRKGLSNGIDSVRGKRHYVRFQVENNSDCALRVKDPASPTGIGEEEVGDWAGGPSDPQLTAENGYSLIDQPGTPAQIFSRAYHIVFSGTKSGNNMHYIGQFWDKDPRLGGATLLSEARGWQDNAAYKYGGFMVGYYERHSDIGKYNAIGGMTVEGLLVGGGTTQGEVEGGGGECEDCELDR